MELLKQSIERTLLDVSLARPATAVVWLLGSATDGSGYMSLLPWAKMVIAWTTLRTWVPHLICRADERALASAGSMMPARPAHISTQTTPTATTMMTMSSTRDRPRRLRWRGFRVRMG